MALDDDSACANHPTKKATAICDGTGDYICTLCAVDIGEKTYSTAYIDRVGVNSLDAPIQRHLKRPDRTVSLCFVLCLLIYFLGPAWVIWSVISFFQMLRYRKTEPIYRQIVGPGDVAVATILVLIPLTGWVFGIGAIVVGIMDT